MLCKCKFHTRFTDSIFKSNYRGERNYHIFYQMHAGLSERHHARLHLLAPLASFHFLSQSGSYTIAVCSLAICFLYCVCVRLQLLALPDSFHFLSQSGSVTTMTCLVVFCAVTLVRLWVCALALTHIHRLISLCVWCFWMRTVRTFTLSFALVTHEKWRLWKCYSRIKLYCLLYRFGWCRGVCKDVHERVEDWHRRPGVRTPQ